MNQKKQHCIYALHRMDFLKTREKLFLYELLDTDEDIFHLTKKEVQALIGRQLRTRRWDPGGCLKMAEVDMKTIERRGIQSLFFWDPGYPPQLREIFDPPFLLFYRGRLPSFEVPAAAVVGTRFPTGSARSAAFQIGMELSRYGVDVISGLAKGIDREAHEGSLEHEGCSIAVLGNGIDTIYPTSSRKVAEKILSHGGVIFSEYFPGEQPLKYHFPARNRIVSGLSRGVVIIQAPVKSGALITADYALEQGRDIYIHKAGISGIQGEGTRRLSLDGAPVIEFAGEILEDWGFTVDSMDLNCDYYRRKYVREGNHCTSNKKMVQGVKAWDNPGKFLATMLEYELSGTVTMHNGDYFRR
jgi:DNA processing protein